MKVAEPGVRVSLKNILYLTDFSPAAAPAFSVARSLARQFESKIFAAHILEAGQHTFVPQQGRVPIRVGEEDDAQKGLRGLEPLMPGMPHELLVCRGEVWDNVAGMIKAHDIDLLVVGTHGRTGLRRLLLGSVAEEIFRKAPCPVITVGPGAAASAAQEIKFGCVLYATDFGPEAYAALPYALSIAQEFQAVLTMVHVKRTPLEPLETPGGVVCEAEKNMAAMIPEACKDWCKPTYVFTYGEPGEGILRIARERHADLIVLGVKRAEHRLGMATHLGAATAHKVVCEAECPVLTVHG